MRKRVFTWWINREKTINPRYKERMTIMASKIYKYYNTKDERDVATELIEVSEETKATWDERYLEAKKVANILDSIGEKEKAKRVRECGSIVIMTNTETGETTHYRTRCNARLCPICTWRNGLKTAYQLKKTVKELQSEYRFVSATFTVKNVTGDNLKAEINHMNKALSKMFRYTKVRKSVKGAYASLEVTYNEKTGMYHPHFHVMFAVLPSYFKKAEYRVKNSEWKVLWQKALDVEYEPQVKVKEMKDTTTSIDELSRYIYYTAKGLYAKLDLGASSTKAVIETLDEALAYKRLYKYYGVIKEVRSELDK